MAGLTEGASPTASEPSTQRALFPRSPGDTLAQKPLHLRWCSVSSFPAGLCSPQIEHSRAGWGLVVVSPSPMSGAEEGVCQDSRGEARAPRRGRGHGRGEARARWWGRSQGAAGLSCLPLPRSPCNWPRLAAMWLPELTTWKTRLSCLRSHLCQALLPYRAGRRPPRPSQKGRGCNGAGQAENVADPSWQGTEAGVGLHVCTDPHPWCGVAGAGTVSRAGKVGQCASCWN